MKLVFFYSKTKFYFAAFVYNTYMKYECRVEKSPLLVWAVFRAKDYLPKLTVVYFLRVRRGTSQHQTRETNAGGGVCCHHSKLISYPHVFFPQVFLFYLSITFHF